MSPSSSDLSPGDRAVALAAQLLRLGLSRPAVTEMLTFPMEDVEAQLAWLPYRKAKRQGAFLIEAVRRNYSPPKEAYYADPQIRPRRGLRGLDQDPERAPRPPDADAP